MIIFFYCNSISHKRANIFWRHPPTNVNVYSLLEMPTLTHNGKSPHRMPYCAIYIYMSIKYGVLENGR